MKSRQTNVLALATAKAGFSTATAYRIEADPRLRLIQIKSARGIIDQPQGKDSLMLSRRGLLQRTLTGGCTVCAALAIGSRYRAIAVDAAYPNQIDGVGYKLWFIGGMRDAIMMGRRETTLDLRTLKGQSHLYGVGPIDELTGEATIADSRPSLARVGADRQVHVTENFEAGVPFFVWAEVPAWRDAAIPNQVRTYEDLEFIRRNGGKEAELTQAFPFVVTGRPSLIDFHIVVVKPDTPAGMAAHQKIQIRFEIHDHDAVLIGFWSDKHNGVFTPMGSNVHIHFRCYGD